MYFFLLDHFINTLSILVIHCILSVIWCSLLIKKYTIFKKSATPNTPEKFSLFGINPPFTSLFAAPITLLIVYKTTKYNLLVTANNRRLLENLAQLITLALILFICSGMPYFIGRYTKQFISKLNSSNFYRSSVSLGLPKRWIFYRLVFMRSMTCSYLDCLGIIFCELFILEPIMNFHGLTSEIWLSFEKLKWAKFFVLVLIFLAFFHAVLVTIRISQCWLQERLKGYDF